MYRWVTTSYGARYNFAWAEVVWVQEQDLSAFDLPPVHHLVARFAEPAPLDRERFPRLPEELASFLDSGDAARAFRALVDQGLCPILDGDFPDREARVAYNPARISQCEPLPDSRGTIWRAMARLHPGAIPGLLAEGFASRTAAMAYLHECTEAWEQAAGHAWVDPDFTRSTWRSIPPYEERPDEPEWDR